MISEIYQTIENIYPTNLPNEPLRWPLMAAMAFHTWKPYLCTRHTTIVFNEKFVWDDLRSGTAFQKSLKAFAIVMEYHLCWGFTLTKTGLNKVTHSFGIYILKHCLFFQGALLLTLWQFCLFLNIFKIFFPTVVLIFSIHVMCLFSILKKIFKLWYDKNLLKRN